MTKPHFRNFAKPLLERNPEFAQSNRIIALKPIRHILRCVHFESTSQKDWARPRWLVIALFEPFATTHDIYGAYVFPGSMDEKKGLWYFSSEPAPDEFAQRVNEIALPILNSVNTIDEFYHFAMQEDYFMRGGLEGRTMTRIVIEAALGDFAMADISSRILLKVPNMWSRYQGSPNQYEIITRNLCPLIAARDRIGIAALLHGWEAESVTRLKLDKYWEPSPFPVEMQT